LTKKVLKSLDVKKKGVLLHPLSAKRSWLKEQMKRKEVIGGSPVILHSLGEDRKYFYYLIFI
jgi:hypothetical protein